MTTPLPPPSPHWWLRSGKVKCAPVHRGYRGANGYLSAGGQPRPLTNPLRLLVWGPNCSSQPSGAPPTSGRGGNERRDPPRGHSRRSPWLAESDPFVPFVIEASRASRGGELKHVALA